MKRLLLLFFGFLSFCLTLQAQHFKVEGKVVNAANKDIIEYASVAVLRMDSTLVGKAISNEQGQFVVTLRQHGSYLLRVSFMGCQTHFQKLSLTVKQPVLNVGSIALQVDDQLLGEAIVKTTLAKIEQKEDTTVFNAGAYRVPEGSTLDALIRQLPGVEVAEDGSITWNGKKITELLVNGKDFFKGDKDVAMKNLPTDLVSKIKAYDKKSDYTEETGIDDGEEKTVLDIATKKKLDKTLISNIDVAYGTEDRYSTKAFVSRFTDRSRISAYVSLGNVNNSGMNGYGGGSGGLTSQKSGGLDFSWENDRDKKEGGKLELGGSAYYGYSGTDMLSTSSSETFLSSNAKSSFSNNSNRSSNSSSYFGTNFRMEWRIDSLTSVKFRPSFNYNKGDNEGHRLTATFDADPYAIPGMVSPLDSLFKNPDASLREIAVNRNEHLSLGNSESKSVNGELSVLRRLNSAGRNVSLRARAGYRDSESRSFSISDIYYFNGSDNRFLNQYSHTPAQNWNYDVRLGFAEPFWKDFVAEARYTYSFKYTDNDRSRYNLDKLETGHWGDADGYPVIGSLPTEADSLAAVRDLNNSQYATYKYYDHKVDLSLKFKNDKIRANIGVELNPEKTKMAYNRPGQHIDTLITRDVFQILPDVRFRYRFSKSKSLDVNYRGYSSQPSMTNLLAVVDNSNPLNISMGNPGLKPSWTNSLNIDYNGYNYESQSGLSVGGAYSQTGKMVSNLLIYDERTGVRYTRPENIDGNWNANTYLMANMGFGKEKSFTVSTYTNLSFNNDVGYVSSFASGNHLSRSLRDVSDYNDIFNSADINKNTTKTIGVNEELKFNYQKNWLNVGLTGRLNYNHSHSSLQDSYNLDAWNFSYGGYLQFNFDCGFSLYSNVRMRSRRGYSDATMNTDELLWNAQLSHSFLKNKAATVSLQFYDILQQQRNISRMVNAMMRNDTWTNGINSYCMVHFIYKLNIFPGQKTTEHKMKKDSEKASGKEQSSKKKGKTAAPVMTKAVSLSD